MGSVVCSVAALHALRRWKGERICHSAGREPASLVVWLVNVGDDGLGVQSLAFMVKDGS